ncbi:hypothetical protein IHE45_10G000100 [Dioscorea alata]|uniref:Uncharacterized protein n=1 Tax=Dioscorea alata TaxID=55571 RepID=A0ACB7V937_DIOAL|nr:hypothetical protein IHE45_10G000100 [Dioscorea alata]
MMSSSSSQHQPLGGRNLFSGFTQLYKGLSLILVGGYVLLQIFPSAATYLALILARTGFKIYNVWFLVCCSIASPID